MKNKRIVDKKLLENFRTYPCIVCGVMSMVCAHHLKTKGSGGNDVTENLIPLCLIHHQEVHNNGLKRFAEKYKLYNYLKVKGWELSDKWRRF